MYNIKCFERSHWVFGFKPHAQPQAKWEQESLEKVEYPAKMLCVFSVW